MQRAPVLNSLRFDELDSLRGIAATMVVSSERDLAARRRHRHQPRNHRWLGDARRGFTDASGRGHGPRVTRRHFQADETPVEVQTRDGRSRNHPGYLWQYGTPGGAAIFEFRMGRGRERPICFLENFAGILQTDAYAAYDRVGGPKMVHAACWAHSRRRFVEAIKLN
jgi:hypothetical protein